jgi:hypothetical protein
MVYVGASGCVLIVLSNVTKTDISHILQMAQKPRVTIDRKPLSRQFALMRRAFQPSTSGLEYTELFI